MNDKKQTLVLFNTLNKTLESFKPIDEIVKIYTCGPTVYRDAHIGNMRTYLLSDTLKKTLIHIGYKTLHVKNITDVGHMRQEMLDQGEDKVIAAAIKEGKTPQEIASYYTDRFLKDEKSLNINPPDYMPKATDHINEMLEMIDILIQKKIAYEVNQNVYFDISKSKNYGILSGNINNLNTLNNEEIDPNKLNGRDFALWKSADKNRSLKWASKYGPGFPGWHIECSAMSKKYLGEYFDIHTGGVDNIFPHHEGEIAQSEGCFSKKHVNYWVHGQHLLSEGIKMSKSKQNEYLISDITSRSMDPLAFRYLCLMTNYRTRLNFTFSSLRAAQKGLNRLRHLYWLYQNDNSVPLPFKTSLNMDSIKIWTEKIDLALLNNLNTSKVMSSLWELTKSNLTGKEKAYIFDYIDPVLSLDFKKYHKKFNLTSIPQIEYKKREQFRKEKKFTLSDKKREQYYKQNIKFFDGQNGNFLVKKLSNFETDINTNHISGSTDVSSLLDSKNKKQLSVCIIADEYLEDFNRCLQSVINNVPNKISYEILIAFNGVNIKNQNQIKSNYKSNGNLKYFHIDPACGAGAVRNILIKQSTGENLILLDTSIEITGNIFEEIITDLKDQNIGLTGPFGLKTNDLNHFHENSINKEYVDAIQLYLLALRRNTLMKVGLFRENFRFYRNLDIDFSFQVKNENFKLLSNPNIPIKRHVHSVWENTHEKTRDELSKDNYKRFLTKWKNYKHLLIN